MGDIFRFDNMAKQLIPGTQTLNPPQDQAFQTLSGAPLSMDASGNLSVGNVQAQVTPPVEKSPIQVLGEAASDLIRQAANQPSGMDRVNQMVSQVKQMPGNVANFGSHFVNNFLNPGTDQTTNPGLLTDPGAYLGGVTSHALNPVYNLQKAYQAGASLAPAARSAIWASAPGQLYVQYLKSTGYLPQDYSPTAEEIKQIVPLATAFYQDFTKAIQNPMGYAENMAYWDPVNTYLGYRGIKAGLQDLQAHPVVSGKAGLPAAGEQGLPPLTQEELAQAAVSGEKSMRANAGPSTIVGENPQGYIVPPHPQGEPPPVTDWSLRSSILPEQTPVLNAEGKQIFPSGGKPSFYNPAFEQEQKALQQVLEPPPPAAMTREQIAQNFQGARKLPGTTIEGRQLEQNFNLSNETKTQLGLNGQVWDDLARGDNYLTAGTKQDMANRANSLLNMVGQASDNAVQQVLRADTGPAMKQIQRSIDVAGTPETINDLVRIQGELRSKTGGGLDQAVVPGTELLRAKQEIGTLLTNRDLSFQDRSALSAAQDALTASINDAVQRSPQANQVLADLKSMAPELRAQGFNASADKLENATSYADYRSVMANATKLKNAYLQDSMTGKGQTGMGFKYRAIAQLFGGVAGLVGSGYNPVMGAFGYAMGPEVAQAAASIFGPTGALESNRFVAGYGAINRAMQNAGKIAAPVEIGAGLGATNQLPLPPTPPTKPGNQPLTITSGLPQIPTSTFAPPFGTTTTQTAVPGTTQTGTTTPTGTLTSQLVDPNSFRDASGNPVALSDQAFISQVNDIKDKMKAAVGDVYTTRQLGYELKTLQDTHELSSPYTKAYTEAIQVANRIDNATAATAALQKMTGLAGLALSTPILNGILQATGLGNYKAYLTQLQIIENDLGWEKGRLSGNLSPDARAQALKEAAKYTKSLYDQKMSQLRGMQPTTTTAAPPEPQPIITGNSGTGTARGTPNPNTWVGLTGSGLPSIPPIPGGGGGGLPKTEKKTLPKLAVPKRYQYR